MGKCHLTIFCRSVMGRTKEPVSKSTGYPWF